MTKTEVKRWLERHPEPLPDRLHALQHKLQNGTCPSNFCSECGAENQAGPRCAECKGWLFRITVDFELM